MVKKNNDTNKLKSHAIVKKCIMRPDCGDLQFEGFQFTGEQYKTISEWIALKEELIIIIESVQQPLKLT